MFQNQRAYKLGTLEYSHGSYHADYFPVVPPARLAHEPSLFAMAKQGRVIDLGNDHHTGTVYYIWSMGPDLEHTPESIYDPSNGLKSIGDIVRVGS